MVLVSPSTCAGRSSATPLRPPVARIALAMNVEKSLPQRHTVRLPEYDYSQRGAYFLTICTHERRPLFGLVVGPSVQLSPAGKIVNECWREIPAHFPNVEAPIHVVMPNHIHGIIVIRQQLAKTPNAENSRRLGAHTPGSIPAIVRSFKAITTRRIRDTVSCGLEVWQRGYYEHMIRTREEFGKTWEYIRLNPANWSSDKENPDSKSTQ